MVSVFKLLYLLINCDSAKSSLDLLPSNKGTLNIFTNQSTNIHSLGTIVDAKYTSMLGQYQVNGGSTGSNFAGGAGTVNIGRIVDGTYVAN